MLTDEERARIRAEEILRLEIRRELEASKPPSSRRKQLWLLLNSSFAVWFLSSVVLAGLTATYTGYQRRRAEEIRKAEIARRLDTEIGIRIWNALEGLRIDKGVVEKSKPLYAPKWIYNNTVSYLDNFFRTKPDNPRDFSIYTEYRDRTFRSLILELSTVIDPLMLSELREALAGYERLLTLAPDTSIEAMTINKEKSLNAVKNLEELLDREVMKSRWRSQMYQPSVARANKGRS